MGMPPSVIKVQEYDPSLDDLARWHEIDISSGLGGLTDAPKENIIRVAVGGVGFAWIIPEGKEDSYFQIPYSGDDEYLIWGDDSFIYIAGLNPSYGERRIAVDSFCIIADHSDCSRRSKLLLSRGEWEEYRKGRSMPDPFVGVQVPEDHARQLGLIV